MRNIVKRILLKRLKELDGTNLHGLDKESFESGYSNGFVNGFYTMDKLIIILGMLLVISVILNFVL